MRRMESTSHLIGVADGCCSPSELLVFCIGTSARYAPLQEAAKHTEVRQVSNPCHSLHPTALCIERLLPVPVLGGGG